MSENQVKVDEIQQNNFANLNLSQKLDLQRLKNTKKVIEAENVLYLFGLQNPDLPQKIYIYSKD